MCTVKADLSSLSDGLAKYKEKVPDVTDPNQNVEKKCNYKLYRTWGFIHQKGTEKHYSKMNYVCN